MPEPLTTSRTFYVGTYSDGSGPGIHCCCLDRQSGALSLVSQTMGGAKPSFLALHPSGKYLYAVNELAVEGGGPGGGVSAFIVEPGTGGLQLLNQQATHGDHPCHLSVDRSGKYLMAANYSSGTLALFPIGKDGRLQETCQVIQHRGSGPDPKRQAGPHAHAIYPDPGNRFVLACDLGTDKIVVYRLEHGQLIPHGEAALSGGAGPRHLDFSPDGRFVYVINELNSTVTVFTYDAEPGSLQPIQTITTLPAGAGGRNLCAEIAMHPTGKFLYGSNRGCHSIVIYGVDQGTGRLTLAGHVTDRINEPRGFALDPGGNFLVAGSQHSDRVIAFAVDLSSGALRLCGEGIAVPKPVCVIFA